MGKVSFYVLIYLGYCITRALGLELIDRFVNIRNPKVGGATLGIVVLAKEIDKDKVSISAYHKGFSAGSS